MGSLSYQKRRGQLEAYFDRTAWQAWARLTSEAPVNRIRATVRRGRKAMQGHLRGMLPENLSGCRILDAGCGTGALATTLAQEGASVVAIDLSPTLVALARERAEQTGTDGVEFRVGDMLAPELGTFDYIVAMDSLIHYRESDMVDMVARLSERARCKLVFTFAPRTPLLSMMHFLGRFFPRGNRSPAIEPIGERRLRRRLQGDARLCNWTPGRSVRVQSGFYISQSMEVERS